MISETVNCREKYRRYTMKKLRAEKARLEIFASAYESGQYDAAQVIKKPAAVARYHLYIRHLRAIDDAIAYKKLPFWKKIFPKRKVGKFERSEEINTY